MPAHKLEGGRTFHDMNQQSINAEEALLAMHFAVNAAAHNAGLREVLGTRCNTQYTRLPKDVDWPDRTSLGAWLMRLTGMRRKNDRPILARTLRFLPMQSNLLLHGVDLTGADFREVNLNGVDLSRAGLQRADLSSAMLHRASLCGANLSEADLENVGLRLAQVVRADLRRTNLQGAGLYGVELGGADLGCAQLGKADLVSAYMRRSNVGGADVADAILRGATFDSDQLSVTTGRPACLPDGTQPTDDNWRGPLPHDE